MQREGVSAVQCKLFKLEILCCFCLNKGSNETKAGFHSSTIELCIKYHDLEKKIRREL